MWVADRALEQVLHKKVRRGGNEYGIPKVNEGVVPATFSLLPTLRVVLMCPLDGPTFSCATSILENTLWRIRATEVFEDGTAASYREELEDHFH